MATINPKKLIQESLIYVLKLYPSLLVFSIPIFILMLSELVISKPLFSIVSLLSNYTIITIFSGGRLWFCYKRINREKINIYQSLQKAIDKFTEIFFVWICYLFTGCPSILFPRLYFVFLLIIINDYLAVDAFKRSWELTRGYGWQIFWALMTLGIINWVLLFFTSLISASIFGISVWELNRDISINEPVFIVNKLLTIGVYCFLVYPLSNVYKVLMFMKLLKLEKES